jgi:hypothetical protein
MAYQRKTYDLFISDELRTILEQIKSESVVADLLCKSRHSKEDLVEDPVNFISISSQDPTRISYLTTERIGSIHEFEYWTSSRRFHMKPGGFISKVFKDVSAKDVEIFSNLYRAEVRKPKFEFKVVTGEDIRRYYHYDYHVNDYGSLGVSCMRYESCQKLFNMYVENPDKISLLLMLNEDGRVMGRALLWNFDGNKIMDRIYTINDEQLVFYFKKWSTENGYYYKAQQNWYNSIQFERLGEGRKIFKFDIKLNNSDFRYYPYMDTFKFFNPDTGTFSNYRPEGRDHYTLCSSDGSKYDWNYLEYDDFDKVYRHRGETVRLHYLNMNAHPDRCNYSNIMDQYILCDHSQWREDIEDYVFIGEYSEMNDNDRIEQRLKDIEEYSKQRTIRRSRRSSSLSQELIESFHNSENSIDMSNLYQQYVDQITLDYENNYRTSEQPSE